MISRRPGTAGSAASRRGARLALLLLPVVVLAGCDAGSATASAPGAAGEAPQPPAAAGAMAPNLAPAADGSLLLSWLEPDGDGHRLRVARFAGGEWGEPSTVAAGDDFFANWADVPSVVEDGDGTLFAHWLARLGGGTYAYGVELARSDDGGATWRQLGLLHADRSPTEHGFVTLLPTGSAVEAVWLDGRATAGGGAMTLRARRLGGGSAPGPEAVIDDA
ncbi:MAG TPA: sialidase family protein, partial [Thermoanaerobaculia bacterium]|nr:sialidase family protein [Thermoanaerobaculia bacterium]